MNSWYVTCCSCAIVIRLASSNSVSFDQFGLATLSWSASRLCSDTNRFRTVAGYWKFSADSLKSDRPCKYDNACAHIRVGGVSTTNLEGQGVDSRRPEGVLSIIVEYPCRQAVLSYTGDASKKPVAAFSVTPSSKKRTYKRFFRVSFIIVFFLRSTHDYRAKRLPVTLAMAKSDLMKSAHIADITVKCAFPGARDALNVLATSDASGRLVAGRSDSPVNRHPVDGQ